MSQLYPVHEPVESKDNLRENIAALVMVVVIAFCLAAPALLIWLYRWALS